MQTSALSPGSRVDPAYNETTRPKFTDVSLENLRRQQQLFAEERQWQQFHTPRNLILALVGEVSVCWAGYSRMAFLKGEQNGHV